MSFLRRLLGGDQGDLEAGPDSVSSGGSTGGEEELPIEADERLPDDLKEFLYPQDEFILRQQRYGRYKWEPPANEPQRDPRLVSLGRLIARTRQPTDEQVRSVVNAWKRRPRGFDETLGALREKARAGDRATDLAAARGFGLGDPAEPGSEPQVPDDFLAAVFAAAEMLAIRDLVTPEELAMLTAPWRAGFGELPEA
jgi:hypothetical protein